MVVEEDGRVLATKFVAHLLSRRGTTKLDPEVISELVGVGGGVLVSRDEVSDAGLQLLHGRPVPGELGCVARLVRGRG